MMFKGVDFWPHASLFPIIGLRRYFIIASALAILSSIVLVATQGLNFGIDFKGGSLIEVQAKSGSVDIPGLRTKLGGLGLGDVQIQSLGASGNEALIRVEQQPGGEKAQEAAATKVRAALGADLNIRRIEVVGPSVSAELKQAGMIAVSAAIIGILLYIWFRFEWQFAVAAIIALTHDVLITVGVFSLLQLEFDLSIVAALLTLAGYSINDTVVVFDRIRENLRRFKRMPLEELLNRSINETLSRTVVTSGTTFVAVLALYVFGTEVIRGFAFTMLFGIIVGTFSSIFVASPLLLWWGVKRDWSTPSADSPKAKEQV